MGIPSYFKRVINDFPEVIKTDLDNQTYNLFLDFNCCIHGCSNELKKNKEYESHTEFEEDLIKSVLEYIDLIFDFVNPKELFYISIDGIPPRSKMVQQRNRRFMKNWRNEKLLIPLRKKNLMNEINAIQSEWDSSAISPGTKFMNQLSQAINNKLKKESKYKYIKSILSDSHEEGEGEYKIYNYMTQNKITKDSIIYGLDADLIMLSLLNETNIHLLREPLFLEVNDKQPFLYLSINKLKESIKLFYDDYFPIDKENLIKYYVFLSFLLGNDFIPHISFISIKNNSIEELLNFYKNISNELNENILIIENKKKVHYKINYNFLIELFHRLSKIETEKLIYITNKYYKKKPFIKKFNNQLDYFKNMLEMYPQLNKGNDVIKVGSSNWQRNYYYHKFNTIDTKDIRDISLNYLETLQFTLEYYFHQTYHPTFYYRYNNSPLLIDVYNYLLSLKLDNSNEGKNIKINIPFNELYPDIKITIPLQLLMILPPSSFNLLEKEEHYKLMTDINQGVLHYYPIDFKVDIHLKDYLWLCNPILPDIDIKLLNSKL
jgi:5'-3' exonuclease